MEMKFSLKTVSDKIENLKDMVKFIDKNYVLIGIPQAKTRREGEPVTNAELLFIHTNGSPVNHIPARPVIEPALKHDSERLTRMMADVAITASKGQYMEAKQKLQLVGMRGQNDVRGWFTNDENGWPPNSPAVQAAKRAKGADNPRPLIDTGELRKSIIYVVVDGGSMT